MKEPYNITPLEVIKKTLEDLKVVPKTVIEIGSYYGGWIEFLSCVLNDANIFTIQTPKDNLLNHIPTDRGTGHDVGTWKDLVKKKLPSEYQSYYDFNLLVDQLNIANESGKENNNKVSLIIDTSPLSYKWINNFDLCFIDIAPDFETNKEQFDYWSKYCNPQGRILTSCFDCGKEMFSYIKNHYAGMYTPIRYSFEQIDYVCAERKGRRI